MIKFFCRDCGKEIWQGLLNKLIGGERIGETIESLWATLYCSDCILKKIKS